jgi:hypothetical protein
MNAWLRYLARSLYSSQDRRHLEYLGNGWTRLGDTRLALEVRVHGGQAA